MHSVAERADAERSARLQVRGKIAADAEVYVCELRVQDQSVCDVCDLLLLVDLLRQRFDNPGDYPVVHIVAVKIYVVEGIVHLHVWMRCDDIRQTSVMLMCFPPT